MIEAEKWASLACFGPAHCWPTKTETGQVGLSWLGAGGRAASFFFYKKNCFIYIYIYLF